MSFQQLIELYNLEAHQEGGYYSQTYRSAEAIPSSVLPARFSGSRQFSTGIYYLLPRGAKSRLHQIAADEMLHFYLGGPMEVIEIGPDGVVKRTTLGQNVLRGVLLQYVVKAGQWFGARPLVGTEFSFVGCTVSPGFDFDDFKMGNRMWLLEKFPSAREIIEELT